MRTLAEYQRHADECLELAGVLSNPEHKAILMRMAQHWLEVAAERRRYLEQQGVPYMQR